MSLLQALHVDPSQMRRWLRNVGSGYADSVIGGLLFLFLTPIFVQRLGVEGYAVWVVSHTITFYLGFLDLGFGSAQVRYHAWFAARGREGAARQLTATIAVTLTGAGAVGALIACGVALSPVNTWMEAAPAFEADFRTVLLILAANLLVAMSASAIENIYEGAQRFDLRNIRSIAMRILAAGAQVILLFRGYGIVALALVELAASCLQLLLDLTIAHRLLPGVLRVRAAVHRGTWRRIRRFALWASVDEILVEGTPHLDKLVVVIILPLAMLTPFALAIALASLLTVIAHPMMETLFPLATRLHAKARRRELVQLLVVGTKSAAAIAAPLAVCLAVFGESALRLWVPEAASFATPGLVPIIIVDTFASVCLWAPGLILMAINRMRTIVLLTLLEIGVALGLILLLAPRYGLTGVALGTLIANVVVGFALQIPMLCRRLGCGRVDFFTSTIGRIILAAAPAVLAAIVIRRTFALDDWLELAAASCAVGVTYLASLAVFGVDRHERARFIELCRGLTRAIPGQAVAANDRQRETL